MARNIINSFNNTKRKEKIKNGDSSFKKFISNFLNFFKRKERLVIDKKDARKLKDLEAVFIYVRDSASKNHFHSRDYFDTDFMVAHDINYCGQVAFLLNYIKYLERPRSERIKDILK